MSLKPVSLFDINKREFFYLLEIEKITGENVFEFPTTSFEEYIYSELIQYDKEDPESLHYPFNYYIIRNYEDNKFTKINVLPYYNGLEINIDENIINDIYDHFFGESENSLTSKKEILSLNKKDNKYTLNKGVDDLQNPEYNDINIFMNGTTYVFKYLIEQNPK